MRIYIVQLKSSFARGFYCAINSVHTNEEEAKKFVEYIGTNEEHEPLARYTTWEVEED